MIQTRFGTQMFSEALFQVTKGGNITNVEQVVKLIGSIWWNIIQPLKNQNLIKLLCEWILRTLFLEKEKREYTTSYILSDSTNKKCPEQVNLHNLKANHSLPGAERIRIGEWVIMDIEFFLGGDKKCSRKKKKKRKKCSGTRPWGRWHYIINILSKYILLQPENCFSQKCWIPNAWKNEAGVLPRVCGQWDPISNNKKSPTSISPPFDDSSSRHREKDAHRDRAHHRWTGILAPPWGMSNVQWQRTNFTFHKGWQGGK